MQNLSLFVCDTLVLQRCSVLEQFIRYDELIVRFFPKRIVIHASRIAGTLDDIYLAVGYGRIVLGRIRQQVERICAVKRINFMFITSKYEKAIFLCCIGFGRIDSENYICRRRILKGIGYYLCRIIFCVFDWFAVQ